MLQSELDSLYSPWPVLISIQKLLLAQAAQIRASIFNFKLPVQFAKTWFLDRLFEQKPKFLPVPVAPTREFCIGFLTSKVEATITNIGEMIGWPSDNVVVGPVAFAAKKSLLRFIPHMLPKGADHKILYRLVLEHNDFGTHNMTISEETGQPFITSIYDWETGQVVPALLFDAEMAVTVDLFLTENASPSFKRIPDDATPEHFWFFRSWSQQYFKVSLSAADL